MTRAFQPGSALRHTTFEFKQAAIAGRELRLHYRLGGGPDPDIDIEELLRLPPELPEPDPSDPVVVRLVDGVHRAFGVSYFKAAVPPCIVAPPVSIADAKLWDLLYTTGMGEFYFRNDIDPRGRVRFPRIDEAPRPVTSSIPRRGRVLLLIGGGKDSIVAREIVKSAGVDADGLSLGRAAWIEQSAAAMDLRHLVIERRIDKQLFALNERRAFNGHVPISALIAFASTLAAYLGGYDEVISANERSANEGNLTWKGLSVNHQWSKSLEFEAEFQDWCVRQISGGPVYFSLLRPLSELRIGKAFTHHPIYFDTFTSCNRNFVQPPAKTTQRWCGRCPKCVFVQLILTPHLDDATSMRIFGANFLADPGNLRLIERLTGIAGVKPFECVGTPSEVRTALSLLHHAGRLPAPVEAMYRSALGGSALQPDDLEPSGPHRIPEAWDEALRAYLRSH